MMDDDEQFEVPSPAITVPETHRLFRLVPAAVDYLKPSMQTALLPADNEDDARRIATEADPLGQDWRDEVRFVADSIITPESHVIGDIVFRSVPTGMRRSKPGKK